MLLRLFFTRYYRIGILNHSLSPSFKGNLMAEKRSKEEIVAQILAICRNKCSKTRILRSANLNSRNVNFFLNQMIECELLAVEPGEVVQYTITSKGLELLETLREIQKQIGETDRRK
jgi:predicted transcriptional regulator